MKSLWLSSALRSQAFHRRRWQYHCYGLQRWKICSEIDSSVMNQFCLRFAIVRSHWFQKEQSNHSDIKQKVVVRNNWFISVLCLASIGRVAGWLIRFITIKFRTRHSGQFIGWYNWSNIAEVMLTFDVAISYPSPLQSPQYLVWNSSVEILGNKVNQDILFHLGYRWCLWAGQHFRDPMNRFTSHHLTVVWCDAEVLVSPSICK